MGFLGFVLKNKQDNYKALYLFIGFVLFYLFNNYPFVMYMKQNAAVLAEYSPFYGAPFTINLFNFDPSMYYGSGNASMIHPLINYLSGPLSYISTSTIGNLFFLILQSIVNTLSVIMIYFYLRKSGSTNSLALLFTIFFGVSSYSIFTAMIPDSYPYVQFIIILSVLYLQYIRLQEVTNLVPPASLAFIHFAATSTNIVPFAGALFVNMMDKSNAKKLKRFLYIALIAIGLAVAFTLLQFVFFGGKSWITSWMDSLQAGGFSYVSQFSFSHHWKAIYLLVISPILTPNLVLRDTGIMAFVSDFTRPYPIYVTIIGFSMIVMAVIGFVRGIKTREVWTVAPFIFFAVLLHIIVGFGLGAFNFDLYLYAGHYLFAFFLLSAYFMMQIKRERIRKALMIVILIFVITTLGNNVIKHQEALNYIKDTYSTLEKSGR